MQLKHADILRTIATKKDFGEEGTRALHEILKEFLQKFKASIKA
jgi:hypothetical protein